MKILIPIIVLILSGCASAEMVNPVSSLESDELNGAPDANAPVNEHERPGVIRYLNQGADFVIKDRRRDAYMQMKQSCRGKPYKILAEGPQLQGGVVTQMGNSAFFSQSEYWYISYQCL